MTNFIKKITKKSWIWLWKETETKILPSFAPRLNYKRGALRVGARTGAVNTSSVSVTDQWADGEMDRRIEEKIWFQKYGVSGTWSRFGCSQNAANGLQWIYYGKCTMWDTMPTKKYMSSQLHEMSKRRKKWKKKTLSWEERIKTDLKKNDKIVIGAEIARKSFSGVGKKDKEKRKS